MSVLVNKKLTAQLYDSEKNADTAIQTMQEEEQNANQKT